MLGFSLNKDLEKDFKVYSTGNSYFNSQPDRYLKFDLLSSSYKKLRGQTDKEITHTREELFKYCRLDTFAMYEIYMKLLSL